MEISNIQKSAGERRTFRARGLFGRHCGGWSNPLFAILFLAAWAFSFWKCRIGTAPYDEVFFWTLPLRFYQGDGMFSSEWSAWQFSGWLTLPLMALRMAIASTPSGSVLFFRYAYTCLRGAAALFLFIRLKRYHSFGALVSSLAFFIYVPYVSGMNYHSMGILNLSMSAVILLTMEWKPCLQAFIAGLFFACAVLCCPYLAVEYAVYLAAVSFYILWSKKRTQNILPAFRIQNFLFFSAGAAAVALLFLASAFRRASFSDILDTLSFITSEPSHNWRPIRKFLSYFGHLTISLVFRGHKWLHIGIYGLLCMIGAAFLVDRKREERRNIYFILVSLDIAALMLKLTFLDGYPDFLMFPLNMLAFFCMVLYGDARMKEIFLLVWIPGMLYSYCNNLSSNMHIYSISLASTVALTGSIVMIAMSEKKICLSACPLKAPFGLPTHSFHHKKRAEATCAAALAAFLLVFQLCAEVYIQYRFVRWGGEPKENYTFLAEDGPEKGILMTKEDYVSYMDDLSLLREIDEKYTEAESVLILCRKPWMYLALSNLRNASCTAWLSESEEGAAMTRFFQNQFQRYYTLHPEKMPDIIYVEPEYTGYLDFFHNDGSYETEELPHGASLLVKCP